MHKCGSNACHLLPLKLQIELQTAHFWRWRATTKTWPGGESRRRDWQRRVPSPLEGRLSSQVATHWLTCFLGIRGMARVAVSTTCFRRPPRHEPRLRGSRIRAFGATRILARRAHNRKEREIKCGYAPSLRSQYGVAVAHSLYVFTMVRVSFARRSLDLS